MNTLGLGKPQAFWLGVIGQVVKAWRDSVRFFVGITRSMTFGVDK